MDAPAPGWSWRFMVAVSSTSPHHLITGQAMLLLYILPAHGQILVEWIIAAGLLERAQPCHAYEWASFPACKFRDTTLSPVNGNMTGGVGRTPNKGSKMLQLGCLADNCASYDSPTTTAGTACRCQGCTPYTPMLRQPSTTKAANCPPQLCLHFLWCPLPCLVSSL